MKMEKNIFIALIAIVVCLGSGCVCIDCPPVPKHYEELGCVPLFQPGEEECPYTYDCSSFELRNRNKCYFNGAAFEPRQEINNDLTASSCSVGCRCGRGYDNRTKFTCAHIDCPEFFGGGGRLERDCIRVYQLNWCCSAGTVCGEAKARLARCEYNGESYLEGERIDTGKSCFDCICGRDFDARVPLAENRHCKKINCMIDLHYGERFHDGCVPIYFGEERCCPIPEFRCPDAETTVLRSLNRAVATNATAECSFGNLRLAVGDVLSPKGNKCVSCSCKVPPYVTCVQQRDC